MRENPNLPESRKHDEHFEAEPVEEESKPEPDSQEFPWELLPNESSDKHDENIPPQPKRRAVIRHDEIDDPSALPTASSCAGPSGWRPADHSPHQLHRLRLDSGESSDDKASSSAILADRRKKRRLNRSATRQFIDSMASVEGGCQSDREENDDASSTASDDSFIVGDDIFD